MSHINVSIHAESDLFAVCRINWCSNLDMSRIDRPQVPTVSVVIDGVNLYFETAAQINQITRVLADARTQLEDLTAENGRAAATRANAEDGEVPDYCAVDDTARWLNAEDGKPQPVVAAMEGMDDLPL
jgi:hypothetical protein